MSHILKDETLGLLTDRYQLSMMQVYWQHHMTDTAVFELTLRSLPFSRNYAVICNQPSIVNYLRNLRFSSDDIIYLSEQIDPYGKPVFEPDFLEYLSNFHFSGNVRMVPEGSIVFAGAPLVQVEASLPEAQLVETFIINQIQTGSMFASKAARCTSVTSHELFTGDQCLEFGTRRAHGVDAAIINARSSYIAGFKGTSLELAGKIYGIPCLGTMAHSYVLAFDNEKEAFQTFLNKYGRTTLLIDTYDCLAAIETIIQIYHETGMKPGAVRIDSGDLVSLSKKVRNLLDNNDLKDVIIVASSDLNEEKILQMERLASPINIYGIGTELAISRDFPKLDTAYKLVLYNGMGKMKLSSDKISYPGKKQWWRTGSYPGELDLVGLNSESHAYEGMLKDAMINGITMPSYIKSPQRLVQDARERCLSELKSLTPEILDISQKHDIHVHLTDVLKQYAQEVKSQSIDVEIQPIH